MKTANQLKRLLWLCGLLGVSGLALPWLARPAAAQSAQSLSTDPLQDVRNSSRDGASAEFSGSSGINSLFDLMHQANFGMIRSPSQYGEDQQENLNDAAAQFRKQQQQRFGQPSTGATGTATGTTMQMSAPTQPGRTN